MATRLRFAARRRLGSRAGWRAAFAPLVVLLLAGPTTLDCASGGPVVSSPPPRVDVNAPDRTANGAIAIDKTGLAGSLAGGDLELVVPVRSVDPRGASGVLHVRLLDVQGVTTVAE